MPENSSSRLKHHVWPPVADDLAQLVEAVSDAHHAHVMPEMPQHRHHVVLGAALLDVGLGESGEIVWRHQRLVDHQQDAALPHNA